MNPYTLEELAKIAQVADLPCFRALDKLANSMMGYGGRNEAGAQMTPPPSVQSSPTGGKNMGTPGSTAMAGMSRHCDKCFHEIKEENANFCSNCGNKLKPVRDIKSPPKGRRVPENGSSENRGDEVLGQMGGPTGGEAALNEELAEGSYADTGKYAAAKKKALLNHPLLRKLKGGAAVLGGGYAGVEGAKVMAEAGQTQRQHPMYKLSGVRFKRGSRFSSLHFKPKGGSYKSVESGIERLKRATNASTQRILARS